MKPVKTKIFQWFCRVAVVAFFGTGLFARCANPMAPQGGPKDTLPPVIVDIRPAFGSTNFKDKRIYIEFDEYVQLRDQQKEFYVSPRMEKKPLLMIKGRGVQIDIQDTLASNTTYAFNFGSSIVDNNEGNPFNSFRYVFSTGDRIDSMVMSGYAVDAYKKDSASKTFIFFYEAEKDSIPQYDSTVLLNKPDVIARAENNGIFIAENLKPIDYRIYAVQDNNGNQLYEPGVDNIAFLDSVYNPVNMPGFDVWYDTTRKYVTAQPQLYFRLFRDEQFKRQYLAGQNRPSQHKAILNFGAYYPEIDTLRFDGFTPDQIIVEYLKPTKDSIAYWFNVAPEELPDTIKGEITYMRHDSLNQLEPYTQSLRLGWKAFETKAQEKEREAKEKERQKAIEEGREPPKEPNPFRINVEASNVLNPEKDIAFVFDIPLVEMDSSRISLIRTEEESKYKVRATIEQDTANMRRWILKAPWQADKKYTLEIPAGVFRNVADESNDTLRSEFTVMDPDKYGTLVFNIKGKSPGSEYVLQLVDQGGNRVLQEVRHAVTGKYTFRYVDPGVVKLKVIEDANKNGQWDKGNLVERIQPERVEMFFLDSGESEIQVKMGWEIGFDIDMNRLFAPVTMESMIEQLRKEDEARLRKYMEDLEKNPDRNKKESRPSGGGSRGGGFNPTGGFNPMGGFRR